MSKLFASMVCLGITSLVGCGGDSDSSTFSSAGAGGTSSPSGGSSSSSGGSSSSSGGSSSGGSSSSSGGSVSSGGASGLQDLPLTLGTAACEKLYECCTPEEIMTNLFAGTDAASCSVAYAALLTLLVGPLQSSINEGRIVYNAGELATCMQAYRATACATLRMNSSDPVAACTGIIVPQQALGEPCSQHNECVNGYCDGGTSAVDGQCAAKKMDGAECEDDPECVSDFCDFVEGTCTQEANPSTLCGS